MGLSGWMLITSLGLHIGGFLCFKASLLFRRRVIVVSLPYQLD